MSSISESLEHFCMSLWMSTTSGSGLLRAFVFLVKDSFGSSSAYKTQESFKTLCICICICILRERQLWKSLCSAYQTHLESFKTLSDDDETWTRRWNCHISSDCLFRIRFGLSISVNFFPQTSTTRFHGMDADFFHSFYFLKPFKKLKI